MITFGSVCSGIEAASVAWAPLGWKAAWLAEIEAFPSAVLAHHYPDTPNLGDMTAIARAILCGEVVAPDLLCGGTPCQAFSIAGLRESLDDARGNLTLKFVELANAIDYVRSRDGRPAATVFWENVPGVLSTHDNAFGCFLAGLAGEDGELEPPEPRPKEGKSSRWWRWDRKLGRHTARWANAGAVFGPTRAVAWRVLDAQYFGVAQRRRRVFVVASARNGFDPVEVLFEWQGLRRDSAPQRETGEKPAAGTVRSTDGGCDVDHARAHHLISMAHGQGGAEIGFDKGPTLTCNHEAPIIAGTLDAASSRTRGAGTSPGMIVATGPLPFDTTQITSAANRSSPKAGDPCPPLAAGAHAPAIAFNPQAGGKQTALGYKPGSDTVGTLVKNQTPAVAQVAVAPTMRAGGNKTGGDRPPGTDVDTAESLLTMGTQVRRLTPRECERLQGFPDDYTAVPWGGKPADKCPDGPRYKAIGNSWAMPNVRWLGSRIAAHIQKLEKGAR